MNYYVVLENQETLQINHAIKGHNNIFEILLPVQKPSNTNIKIGIKVQNAYILSLKQPYMIIQDARDKIIPKYIIIVIVCKVFGSISKFVCSSVLVGFNIIDFFAIKNDKPNNINNIDQTIPNTQLGGLNITFDPAFF